MRHVVLHRDFKWTTHKGPVQSTELWGFYMKEQEELANEVLLHRCVLECVFKLELRPVWHLSSPHDTAPAPWHTAAAFSSKMSFNLLPLADSYGKIASAKPPKLEKDTGISREL